MAVASVPEGASWWTLREQLLCMGDGQRRGRAADCRQSPSGEGGRRRNQPQPDAQVGPQSAPGLASQIRAGKGLARLDRVATRKTNRPCSRQAPHTQGPQARGSCGPPRTTLRGLAGGQRHGQPDAAVHDQNLSRHHQRRRDAAAHATARESTQSGQQRLLRPS